MNRYVIILNKEDYKINLMKERDDEEYPGIVLATFNHDQWEAGSKMVNILQTTVDEVLVSLSEQANRHHNKTKGELN